MSIINLKNISKSYDGDEFAIKDLSLTVNDGEFLVLVGPSGCGKSTTLRMIAGLEGITSGSILIDDVIVNELPPGKRDIGMVFQNYALYPHMTVEDNLAFPLKVKKIDKKIIAERVNEISELVELGNLLKRYPKQLSGGQRQRVALGRAIIRKPKVFLFDEPLSNLDAKLRTQMRNEIITLQRKLNVTAVYVTHDQTEAMTMGDRIILMNNGEIMQIGTPDEIYNRPQNLFTAEFIGSPKINFFSKSEFSFIGNLPQMKSKITTLAVRPDDLVIESSGTGATIVNIENLGHEYLYHLDIKSSRFISRSRNRIEFRLGQEVGIGINADNILKYDEKGQLIND
ncbi:MAG: ABC transporter ATP-binding protein [Candidatus Kapaibacterium sp.]